MRTYIAVTGTVFGLLTVAHIWRIVAENPSLAKQPWFVLITLASAALCGWAVRLLLRPR